VARVIFPNGLRHFAGGAPSVDVDARSVGELIRALDVRFPGLGRELGAGMTVAVDGEILQDAQFEPLRSDSEVHFLPALRGG
jgi:sulfur-carrier protein